MARMQLALDFVTPEQGVEIARLTEGICDIIELGTPFLLENGFAMIGRFREEFPNAVILADTKIMDAGSAMCSSAFEAGANIVTVCARTYDSTIRHAIRAAKDHGGEVLCDLIGVPMSEMEARIRQLDPMGVDYICTHFAVTAPESAKRSESLELARRVIRNSRLAVAGGVGRSSVKELARYSPDVVIVGSAITSSDDPREAAEAIRAEISKIK